MSGKRPESTDQEHELSVVLYQPRIPPNTGNIARLCAATNCDLHIIKPIGFVISDRTLRRAGLDYWEFVDVQIHDSFDQFEQRIEGKRMFYVTKHGEKIYTDVEFNSGDVFIFGSETEGLPAQMLQDNRDKTIRIPMFSDNVRSLNLATSVGIVLYEAIRQLDYKKVF